MNWTGTVPELIKFAKARPESQMVSDLCEALEISEREKSDLIRQLTEQHQLLLNEMRMHNKTLELLAEKP